MGTGSGCKKHSEHDSDPGSATAAVPAHSPQLSLPFSLDQVRAQVVGVCQLEQLQLLALQMSLPSFYLPRLHRSLCLWAP